MLLNHFLQMLDRVRICDHVAIQNPQVFSFGGVAPGVSRMVAMGERLVPRCPLRSDDPCWKASVSRQGNKWLLLGSRIWRINRDYDLKVPACLAFKGQNGPSKKLKSCCVNRENEAHERASHSEKLPTASRLRGLSVGDCGAHAPLFAKSGRSPLGPSMPSNVAISPYVE